MSTDAVIQFKNSNEIARLTLQAILNDECLKQLNKEKLKIYQSQSRKFKMIKDGEVTFEIFDEKKHPQLLEINRLIEHRTQQIKRFFSDNQ
jgi:hypothetical protein